MLARAPAHLRVICSERIQPQEYRVDPVHKIESREEVLPEMIARLFLAQFSYCRSTGDFDFQHQRSLSHKANARVFRVRAHHRIFVGFCTLAIAMLAEHSLFATSYGARIARIIVIPDTELHAWSSSSL